MYKDDIELQGCWFSVELGNDRFKMAFWLNVWYTVEHQPMTKDECQTFFCP